MERLNSKEYSDSFKYGFDEVHEISPEIKKMSKEEIRAYLISRGFAFDEQGEIYYVGESETPKK